MQEKRGFRLTSSHDWQASTFAIMLASFCRMTGWPMRGLPKTRRCEAQTRHSSTARREVRADEQHMTQRSWLKLDRMTY
jgi:hypothetical protein